MLPSFRALLTVLLLPTTADVVKTKMFVSGNRYTGPVHCLAVSDATIDAHEFCQTLFAIRCALSRVGIVTLTAACCHWLLTAASMHAGSGEAGGHPRPVQGLAAQLLPPRSPGAQPNQQTRAQALS